MEDDFALRYVRIYPGVNSREELVTLAPGLRPERRFAPLTRGLFLWFLSCSPVRTSKNSTNILQFGPLAQSITYILFNHSKI